MHLVHPHCRSLLPSTVHNALALVNIICIHAGGCTLSISAKPRSATHFPTSTTCTGLQHLLVAAHVHVVWFRAMSHHVWLPPCTNIFHTSHIYLHHRTVYNIIYYLYLHTFHFDIQQTSCTCHDDFVFLARSSKLKPHHSMEKYIYLIFSKVKQICRNACV